MTEQQAPIVPSQPADEEIDLIALAKKIWKGRKTIFITLGIFTLLGVFIALVSPKEYTATSVMVPQMSTSSAKSGLSGLAAMAGLNIGMEPTSDLSPVVYPKIVSSIPFKLELMNTPLSFSKVGHPVSLLDYSANYSKPSVLGIVTKYTIGLPGVIISAIKGKPKVIQVPAGEGEKPIYLNEDEYLLAKTLDEMVTLSVDTKEGYLTLVTKMPEALAAAQLAQKAQQLLQREITNFKIDKAKAELKFIQERYNVAKSEFEKVQVELASNTDRSKFFTSQLSSISTDRIQTRYNIAYTVYQDLAKQLEQAKIQVEKDTPVFTIIEPVTIPTERSKPKRSMILLVWIFLGGVVGVAIVFGKDFLGSLKQKWEENEGDEENKKTEEPEAVKE